MHGTLLTPSACKDIFFRPKASYTLQVVRIHPSDNLITPKYKVSLSDGEWYIIALAAESLGELFVHLHVNDIIVCDGFSLTDRDGHAEVRRVVTVLSVSCIVPCVERFGTPREIQSKAVSLRTTRKPEQSFPVEFMYGSTLPEAVLDLPVLTAKEARCAKRTGQLAFPKVVNCAQPRRKAFHAKALSFATLPDVVMLKLLSYMTDVLTVTRLLMTCKRMYGLLTQLVRTLDVSMLLKVSTLQLVRVACHFSLLLQVRIWPLEADRLSTLAMGCPLLRALHVVGVQSCVSDEFCDVLSLHLSRLNALQLQCGSAQLSDIDPRVRPNSISDRGLALLVQRCKFLRRLELWFCPYISDASLREIALCQPEMLTLELKRCDISDTGVAVLVSACAGLEQLGLQECARVTSSSIGLLASLTVLTSLDLSHTSVCEDPFPSSVRFQSTLRVLRLNGCQGLSSASLENVIRSAPSLVWLGVARCSLLGNGTLESINHLAASLRVVDLSELGPSVFETLQYATTNCRMLRALYVCDTQVTNDCLSHVFAVCRYLRVLDARRCPLVGDQALKHLSDTLPEMFALAVSQTAVTSIGIQHVANKCFGLKLVLVAHCQVTGSSLLHLALRCSRIEVLDIRGCIELTSTMIEVLGAHLKMLNAFIYLPSQRHPAIFDFHGDRLLDWCGHLLAYGIGIDMKPSK
eukprot:TRINITY_DN1176_c0_g1_i4.p1 TRINITY_DN1176_c0_g1~~TRINITY_DN1176_c0_g1_i4.p1  ORF type:complete len:690 (+),score=58.13 TRINITY_DN1176_c0_g1_i4:366-2435(+)